MSLESKPVLKLLDYDYTSKRQTVLEMLEEAIEDIKASPEENNFNKAVILFLNDSDGERYITSFSAAGMKRSEIVALCEAIKMKFLRGLIGDRQF